MRWTRHMPGDERTVRRFAWFPVACGSSVFWLEHYEATERYVVGWEWEGWELVRAEPGKVVKA